MKRRKREISGEDKLLWAHVARSAKPLPGKPVPDLPVEPVFDPAPATSLSLVSPTLPAAKPRQIPPLTGFDKRLKRDVTRGIRAIEARIDLHGMRQGEAHQALLAFMYRAHHQGIKLVLVITGKGGGLDARGEERGVLKRMVPHWLADPALRRLVLGYEAAGLGHGGEGALYVRIRRDRHREI